MRNTGIYYKTAWIAGIIFICLTTTLQAEKGTEQVITREMAFPEGGTLNFNNKSGPLAVSTWDKSAVKLEIHVVVDGDPKDVQTVIDQLNAMNFSVSGSEVTFNTRFFSRMAGIIPGSFKVTLINGKAVNLSKLEISYRLFIPATAGLSIYNAYDDVTLPDLAGKINLEIYEGDLRAGTLSGSSSVNLKYGEGEVAALKNADLVLYEAKLKVGGTGDLDVSSKYSELSVQSAGNLKVDSYEDKIAVAKHGDVAVRAKYTTLTLNDYQKGTFDLYECVMTAGDANITAIISKYSRFEFRSVTAVVFTEAYETKFSALVAGDLKATSKYSVYNIGRFTGSLTMASSYEDDITLSAIDPAFTGITLGSKYSSLDMTVAPAVRFNIHADLQYTDFDYPKARFTESHYHKENEKLQFTGAITGASETAPTVDVVMYEGRLVIR